MLSTEQAIDLAEGAAERFVAAVSPLGEQELRAPASLPGWTRAYGVAHVAQALGAYIRILSGAARSDRDAGACDPTTAAYSRPVEETAALPGPALVRELSEGAEEFIARARSLTARDWEREVTSGGGWQHTARYTLLRCLRELETHHTDLGIGYDSDKWPAPYVRWALDDTLHTLRSRNFPVTAVEATDLCVRWEIFSHGPVVAGPSRLLLGWLAGRVPAQSLSSVAQVLSSAPVPEPPPWPQPPVKGW
ncbi:maleylpyruvate isomerase family mycothiol-dependent enzyme [Streptomyces sp. N35]|uniref:maleylpyruvate isomerase family mycothiol-dependent enzyme n=1 Tax=Streptomyces sp. N35 TaxID=2795730 RepID=UPI0018F7C48E|nr:maleylpyruvate isomerase family mycothiol-dependent enzyme [Streptomyces sp. N35]